MSQASSQSGQALKFTTSDSCDRIKDEFQFLQAQYHRYAANTTIYTLFHFIQKYFPIVYSYGKCRLLWRRSFTLPTFKHVNCFNINKSQTFVCLHLYHVFLQLYILDTEDQSSLSSVLLNTNYLNKSLFGKHCGKCAHFSVSVPVMWPVITSSARREGSCWTLRCLHNLSTFNACFSSCFWISRF